MSGEAFTGDYGVLRESFQRKLGRPRMWPVRAVKMVQRARINARTKNIPFDLNARTLEIPSHCPYLRWQLKYDGDVYDPQYATLDRIDNSRGYVNGNVEIISRQANVMKNNASIVQLIAFARGVLARHDRT